jgi:hypothetical protein
LVKVEMLVNTYYKRPLKPGDVVEVDVAVAERWENHGIAKQVASEPDDPPVSEETPAKLPKRRRGGKQDDAG